MNAYSNFKGGATYDSSVNTAPPTLSSMFYCGEWTLGVVLDTYWIFLEAGDHYLVCILDGLDPCSAYFSVLPPQFSVPYDDQYVCNKLLIFFLKNNVG